MMLIQNTGSGRKEKIYIHMFFSPLLCSDIPELALGILKRLIRVCFRDVLQLAA